VKWVHIYLLADNSEAFPGAKLFLGYGIHPLSKGRISPPGIWALGVTLSWFGFDASELSRFTLILEQGNSTGFEGWNEHNKKSGRSRDRPLHF
jgi:hypothetical protein